MLKLNDGLQSYHLTITGRSDHLGRSAGTSWLETLKAIVEYQKKIIWFLTLYWTGAVELAQNWVRNYLIEVRIWVRKMWLSLTCGWNIGLDVLIGTGIYFPGDLTRFWCFLQLRRQIELSVECFVDSIRNSVHKGFDGRMGYYWL